MTSSNFGNFLTTAFSIVALVLSSENPLSPSPSGHDDVIIGRPALLNYYSDVNLGFELIPTRLFDFLNRSFCAICFTIVNLKKKKTSRKCDSSEV